MKSLIIAALLMACYFISTEERIVITDHDGIIFVRVYRAWRY